MTQTGDGRRIGLIGCGRWGSLILRDLVSLGAEVHVVVPGPTDRDRILSSGAVNVVHHPDEVGPVDGIVVATPTSTHADVVDTLLEYRVPIFVEKPLTDDPSRARRIAAAAPDRVFVMDKWRYHAGVRKLRELVRSGSLGAIRRIETIRVQNGMPHTDVDCSWILLPHDLSIALEVLGELPIPTSASGRVRDDVLIGATAEFAFRDGTTMSAGFGIDAGGTHRQISVIGTIATACLAGGWEEEVVVTADDGSPPQRIPAVGELPLLAELRAFLDHLDGGPQPRSSAAEGAAAVAIVDRVRELAR